MTVVFYRQVSLWRFISRLLTSKLYPEAIRVSLSRPRQAPLHFLAIPNLELVGDILRTLAYKTRYDTVNNI